MHKTIKIGERDYRFIISPAIAKKHAQFLSEQIDNPSDDPGVMIDFYVDLLHAGLRSGRYSLVWWRRLFVFIPSKKRLEHIVSFSDAQSMFLGDTQGGEKEEDESDPK